MIRVSARNHSKADLLERNEQGRVCTYDDLLQKPGGVVSREVPLNGSDLELPTEKKAREIPTLENNEERNGRARIER